MKQLYSIITGRLLLIMLFSGMATLAQTSGPRITTVAEGTCGAILPALNTQVFANLVAGANGYQWRITTLSGPSVGEVQTLDTPLRVMKMTQLANYAYNTTYKVEVAAYYQGVLQPFSETECSVTTPVATTQLSQCAYVMSAPNDIIYADIVPFATGYRFKVTDPVNPANTQTVDRLLREFRMTQITDFEVLHGKTYLVEVSVRNTDGTYLPYGQTCLLTTAPFPTTQLAATQCDDGFGMPYVVPSMGTQIYCASYPGAIGYVFRLTGAGLPINGIEITKPMRVFKLSEFDGMGLVPGQSYNVNVRLIFEENAPSGSYGKTCALTVPSVVASMRVADQSFDAVAYPNPFSESVSIRLEGSAQVLSSIRVYDMTGRLLDHLETTGNEINMGESYPTGIYNVIVSQGDESKTLRIIKR